MKSILVDYREHTLCSHFSKDFEYSNKNLILGDIQFHDQEQLVLLIERKTVDDLVQSIKDGRYREQKNRMSTSNIDPHQCVYLIEGRVPSSPLNAKYKGLYLSAVWGSILKSSIRDGFHVFFTHTIQDTARLIEYLSKKFYSNESPFLFVDNGTRLESPGNHSFKETIHCDMKRKNDISVSKCFMYQLCQIPGVSEKIAVSLSKEAATMVDFIDKLRSKENALKWLTSLQVSEKRKIGKKTSEKIINFLGISVDLSIKKKSSTKV